ncbi:peptide-methionine (S)-S-oxide reductase MsrA [Anaerohalosphaera lusitana]
MNNTELRSVQQASIVGEKAISENVQSATFAGGCFWGVEAVFRQTEGVVATAVGYTGGSKENPTYREVCTGRTGHAEAVRVYYDPDKTNYAKLVDKFFASHNPTTLNRQGPDVGTQYRSAIFYHDESQKEIAKKTKEALQDSAKFERPIVTEIKPAGPFYMAEDYHQRYFEKNKGAYCPHPVE